MKRRESVTEEISPLNLSGCPDGKSAGLPEASRRALLSSLLGLVPNRSSTHLQLSSTIQGADRFRCPAPNLHAYERLLHQCLENIGHLEDSDLQKQKFDDVGNSSHGLQLIMTSNAPIVKHRRQLRMVRPCRQPNQESTICIIDPACCLARIADCCMCWLVSGLGSSGTDLQDRARHKHTLYWGSSSLQRLDELQFLEVCCWHVQYQNIKDRCRCLEELS